MCREKGELKKFFTVPMELCYAAVWSEDLFDSGEQYFEWTWSLVFVMVDYMDS